MREAPRPSRVARVDRKASEAELLARRRALRQEIATFRDLLYVRSQVDLPLSPEQKRDLSTALDHAAKLIAMRAALYSKSAVEVQASSLGNPDAREPHGRDG